MKRRSIFNTFFITTVMAVMLMIPQFSWADTSATAASASEFNAAAAAATAGETAEITLTDDITGNLVVPEGKTVRLVLNGHSITADSGAVITNNGTLLIEGEGSVTAGNTYAVVNHGEMAIYGGTFNKADPAKTASLIDNGWYNAADRPDEAQAELAIHGGTFDGGSYTVLKNDSYGVMTVLDGEFNTTPNAYGAYNVIGIQECGSVLSIKGGTFNCGVQLESASSYDGEEKGVMIQGGTFNGDVKTKGISTASATKAEKVTLAITEDAVFNKSLSISNSGAPAGTAPFVIDLFQVKEVGGTLTFGGNGTSTLMDMEGIELDGLTIGGGLILSNTTECTVQDSVINGSTGIKAGNVYLTNVQAKTFSNNATGAQATIGDGCVIEKVNATYNAGNTLSIVNATVTTIQNTGTNKNAGFDSINILSSEIGAINTSKGELLIYGGNVETLTIEDKYVADNPVYVYIDGKSCVLHLVNNRSAEEDPNTEIEMSPVIGYDEQGNFFRHKALLNSTEPYDSYEDLVNDCADNDMIEIYAPADLVFPESGHNALVTNYSGGDITINGRTLANDDSITVELVVLRNAVDTLTTEKANLETEKTNLTTALAAATQRAETAEAAKTALQTQLTQAQIDLAAKQADYIALLEDYNTASDGLAQAQADLQTAQNNLAAKQTELDTAQAALTAKQADYDALVATHNATTAQLTQAQADLQTAQNDLAAKQTALENAQTALEEKQTAYDALLERYNTASDGLAQAKSDLAAKQAELATAQATLTAKQADYDALVATHNATTAQLTQAQADLATAQAALTAKQAEYIALLEQNTTLNTQLTAKQAELEEAQASVTSLTTQLNEATTALTQATAQVTSLTTQLNEATTALAQATADKAALQSQLTQAQTDLAALQQEKADLEAERNNLRNQNDALKNENDSLKEEKSALEKAKEEAEKAKAAAEEAAAKIKAELDKIKAEQAARQAAAEKEAAAKKAAAEAAAAAKKIAAANTPAKVSFTKATAGKKRVNLKFRKVAKNVTGYQIRLVDTKTKQTKNVYMSKSNKKTISKTVKGLRRNAKYRINIRAYKKVNGKMYYGAWSNTRTVKVR